MKVIHLCRLVALFAFLLSLTSVTGTRFRRQEINDLGEISVEESEEGLGLPEPGVTTLSGSNGSTGITSFPITSTIRPSYGTSKSTQNIYKLLPALSGETSVEESDEGLDNPGLGVTTLPASIGSTTGITSFPTASTIRPSIGTSKSTTKTHKFLPALRTTTRRRTTTAAPEVSVEEEDYYEEESEAPHSGPAPAPVVSHAGISKSRHNNQQLFRGSDSSEYDGGGGAHEDYDELEPTSAHLGSGLSKQQMAMGAGGLGAAGLLGALVNRRPNNNQYQSGFGQGSASGMNSWPSHGGYNSDQGMMGGFLAPKPTRSPLFGAVKTPRPISNSDENDFESDEITTRKTTTNWAQRTTTPIPFGAPNTQRTTTLAASRTTPGTSKVQVQNIDPENTTPKSMSSSWKTRIREKFGNFRNKLFGSKTTQSQNIDPANTTPKPVSSSWKTRMGEKFGNFRNKLFGSKTTQSQDIDPENTTPKSKSWKTKMSEKFGNFRKKIFGSKTTPSQDIDPDNTTPKSKSWKTKMGEKFGDFRKKVFGSKKDQSQNINPENTGTKPKSWKTKMGEKFGNFKKKIFGSKKDQGQNTNPENTGTKPKSWKTKMGEKFGNFKKKIFGSKKDQGQNTNPESTGTKSKSWMKKLFGSKTDQNQNNNPENTGTKSKSWIKKIFG